MPPREPRQLGADDLAAIEARADFYVTSPWDGAASSADDVPALLAGVAYLREECDGLRARHADAHQIARDAVDALGRCVAERDEALRGVIPRGYVVITLAEADAAREARESLTQERDALRATIEGRTTPPTDAEIAAHDAAGGRWLVQHGEREAAEEQRGVSTFDWTKTLRRLRDAAPHGDGAIAVAFTWWPLDSNGRPCAWPVVTEAP